MRPTACRVSIFRARGVPTFSRSETPPHPQPRAPDIPTAPNARSSRKLSSSIPVCAETNSPDDGAEPGGREHPTESEWGLKWSPIPLAARLRRIPAASPSTPMPASRGRPAPGLQYRTQEPCAGADTRTTIPGPTPLKSDQPRIPLLRRTAASLAGSTVTPPESAKPPTPGASPLVVGQHIPRWKNPAHGQGKDPRHRTEPEHLRPLQSASNRPKSSRQDRGHEDPEPQRLHPEARQSAAQNSAKTHPRRATAATVCRRRRLFAQGDLARNRGR